MAAGAMLANEKLLGKRWPMKSSAGTAVTGFYTKPPIIPYFSEFHSVVIIFLGWNSYNVHLKMRPHREREDLHGGERQRAHDEVGRRRRVPRAGGNCIKIGLPGKLTLSKRNGLWEVLYAVFSASGGAP